MLEIDSLRSVMKSVYNRLHLAPDGPTPFIQQPPEVFEYGEQNASSLAQLVL